MNGAVGKQAAFASQFLETVKALGAKSVREAYVIASLQNSVSFRLSRSYDRRNLGQVSSETDMVG
jgi:hypothetical protein